MKSNNNGKRLWINSQMILINSKKKQESFNMKKENQKENKMTQI